MSNLTWNWNGNAGAMPIKNKQEEIVEEVVVEETETEEVEESSE